jgi:hypothetical protein
MVWKPVAAELGAFGWPAWRWLPARVGPCGWGWHKTRHPGAPRLDALFMLFVGLTNLVGRDNEVRLAAIPDMV